MIAGNPTFFVEPDSIGLDLTDIILPPFVKGKWLDPESNRGIYSTPNYELKLFIKINKNFDNQ
jgi:hypothetical protein